MAGISLPGLFTGIDTSLLISQLMAVNQRRLNTLEASKSTWEEKNTALSDLENKLATFRTTVRALDDANELRAFNVTSSDTDIITAEATYSAFEGNHTVVINQLANSEQWVHTTGLEYAENYVKTSSAGTFIYSYNHKETIITTTTTTTLQDLVGLINNDANNPGVTASLLYYAGAYHLVLNGNDAGSDYAISINASNTEVRQADSAFTADGNATLSTKITDLDLFIPGEWGGDEKITITGKDHNGNSISGEVSVNTNTMLSHLIGEINDAFDGRAKAVLENGKIVLTDDTCGTSQMELTLAYDPGSGTTDLTVPTISRLTEGGSTTANLTNFAASDFTESQAAQDSKIKVDGFPSTSAVSEVQTLTPTISPGSGTYTLTYDGQTTAAIDYNDPPTGIGSIQEALGALSNVSSGDITVGGGANGLADGALTFTFLNTLGDVSLISINPANLDQSDNSNYTMETTTGSDGNISRSSNTIDDVIPGVTLHLHDTTNAGGEEVNLTRDIESVKEKLNKMVTAYNMVVAYLQEKAGYNEILERGGVLMGDYVVSTIRSRIRDPFIERTSGFLEDIDTFLMAGDIGLELDRDGMLSLDGNVFDEAVGENYMDALAVIGAAKTGSSDSNVIQFYGASSSYTTAGTYDVQVDFDGVGNITAARIKLSTESTFRSMTIDGNIATGNSTFDDDGDPLYPENGLQLTVPTTGTPSSTITATVMVKQGFAGALEDVLKGILRTTDGSIQIDQEYTNDVIEGLKDKIEAEEERLSRIEARLVERFARLERYLALMQRQLGAVGMLSIS